MKCPMRRWNYVDKHGEMMVDLAKCEEVECAWWDVPTNQCAILTLARRADWIDDKLSSISRKMPKDFEPRASRR